jgi:hypothetical protein
MQLLGCSSRSALFSSGLIAARACKIKKTASRPELKAHPVSDPNKDQFAEKLVQNMINFILNGVSPVKEAPELPPRILGEITE